MPGGPSRGGMVAAMVVLTLVALVLGLIELIAIAYRCSSSDVLDEPDPDTLFGQICSGRDEVGFIDVFLLLAPAASVAIGGGIGLENRSWAALLLGAGVAALVLVLGLVILSLPRG